MKKITTKLLVAVTALFIGLTLVQCGVSDSRLAELAAETNSQCPMRMDYMTTLDSVIAKPGGMLHYYYSVSQTSAELSEVFSVDVFETNLKSQLVAMLNSGTPQADIMKKTEATFVHEYYDSNNDLFTKVVLTPEDYNK